MPARIAIVIATICIADPADAYRPFDGTDADVAEAGKIELEIGPLQGARTNGQNAYEPGGVFNYGFAASWELVVDIDGLVATMDSVVATDVLIKHVLRNGSLQDGTGPSVAVETGVLLPSLPARGGEAGWSLALIASQKWDPITVHLNAAALYERDRDVAGWASAIIEGSTHPVRPVAELLVARDNINSGSALAGAIWKVSDDLSFDAAALVGRGGNQTTMQIRAGLTWAFAL